ncbi:hypothetical protein cyc_09560 [Cyclospora cayetanensis]|uniref:Uncharacterized protein n=1 Tax=Cyclospora cayetanensis TaxID=88456 RepID=A0A1D3CR50_9EIME|nr:hypothetical protein cyc_09560 [Cyclospora cayetanensis]
MRSGEVALEWAVNQDFQVDFGFPWFDSQGYNWFRAFSIPAGAYEVKFGFYFEKRTHVEPQGNSITFGAGFALYAGYFFGMGNSVAWLRAGIGVFAVLQAELTIDLSAQVTNIGNLPNIVKGVLIEGAIGIFAYGEGGIDVWTFSTWGYSRGRRRRSIRSPSTKKATAMAYSLSCSPSSLPEQRLWASWMRLPGVTDI